MPTPGLQVPLLSINTSGLLDLICINFLTQKKSKGSFETLVVTDHFFVLHRLNLQKIRRHSQWWGCCEETSSAGLDSLQSYMQIRDAILRVGWCRSCADLQELQSHILLCTTLRGMLSTLPLHLKSNWHEHVDALTHAYNCTCHDSTGYEPYFLMFGRHRCMPTDLVFGLLAEIEPCKHADYAKMLQDNLFSCLRAGQAVFQPFQGTAEEILWF